MTSQTTSVSTLSSIATAELATVHGGDDLSGFARIGGALGELAGDGADGVLGVSRPYTHFNNRASSWGYWGEVAGRYADRALGMSSGAVGDANPGTDPRLLSGGHAHWPRGATP